MDKERFSVYTPPISSANLPVGDPVSLETVYKRIRGTKYKAITELLRRLIQEGKLEEYRIQKGHLLSSATFGGVFDYRSTNKDRLQEGGYKGLLQSSGYIIIDIDHLSEIGLPLEDLKTKLSQDREIGVRLVFVSPSGDGLKVICKTSKEIPDPQTYKSVYNSLRYYINGKYGASGEIVDKSGSDISRLCLLAHDRDAILTDYTEEFNPDLHPVPEENKPLRETIHYTGESLDFVEELVRRVEESGKDIAPTRADYIPLVYSFASLGERGRDLLHRVCSLSPKYNQRDTDRDFNSALPDQAKQSIGTFFNMADANGIYIKSPEERYRLPQLGGNTQKETTIEHSETAPEDRWKDYLTIPSLSDIASTKREGIKTEYRFFGANGKEEYLTLRSGALTLICGKSSHGKSKFLQNLALQTAQSKKEEDGVVLFFTYEEELSEVLSQFANIHADIPQLSAYDTPNTEVILDYFKVGSLPRCTRSKRSDLLPKLEEFESLYYSGKLRVYYSDLYSEDLCELVRYLSQSLRIKAVFVDYIQLLYRAKKRQDRKEEIKEICNDLRSLAIDLSVPVILSAQLNRVTPNPTDMSEDNIAESSDITRYANTIVCLWNSAFENVTTGKEAYLATEEGKKLQSRGFTLGEPGKIYAKITKNRGGSPYIDSVLKFRGETGKIYTNSDLPIGSYSEPEEPTFREL